MYYGVAAVGFLVGCALGLYNLHRAGLTTNRAVVVIVAGVYAGLIGSRVLYVLYSAPSYLIQYPLHAFAFWQGGLSWLGGPPIACIVLAIGLHLCGHPVLKGLGQIAPGLALCHALARLSCIQEGCCYGRETGMPWAIYSKSIDALAHPTQVYSMLGELFAVVVLQYLLVKPKMHRYLMPLYFVILGSHRFMNEFFRGDPPGDSFLFELRFYQGIALILLAMGAAGLAAAYVFRNKTNV